MVMEEQGNSSGLASESVPVPRVHDASHENNIATIHQDESRARSGKPRFRKKALHARILKQMEFYFSDANLSKDRFLGKLISTDPYVDLEVFLRCNKIRELTQNINRIAKALQGSTILKLSEDGKKVCRITPINARENCDACTIYVQGLPPDTDHNWLDNIFSQYGTVAYVSIPRYKTNHKLKGFAFIEFETIEGAEKCLKAFQEKNCTLPPHTGPNELLSITTFSEDDPPNELDSDNLGSKPIAQKIKVLKRPATIDNGESENDCTKSKKARLKVSDNEKTGDNSENPNQNIENDGMDVGENENCEQDPEKMKKSRRRKRRGRPEQPDIIDFGLQIMAKKDWKKLRNKYLQLQRDKMKQLKQHLRKARWNQWNSHDKKDQMESEESTVKEDVKELDSSAKFNFSEGLIVKLVLDELCTNPKSLKHEFRGEPGVQYIDVREGDSCAHIRCDTSETANNFVKKHSEDKAVTILQGSEEKAYWNKMAKDREEKFGKKIRVKQRGRDKLLKKAEKVLGKHIKFDEV